MLHRNIRTYCRVSIIRLNSFTFIRFLTPFHSHNSFLSPCTRHCTSLLWKPVIPYQMKQHGLLPWQPHMVGGGLISKWPIDGHMLSDIVDCCHGNIVSTVMSYRSGRYCQLSYCWLLFWFLINYDCGVGYFTDVHTT